MPRETRTAREIRISRKTKGTQGNKDTQKHKEIPSNQTPRKILENPHPSLTAEKTQGTNQT